MKLHNVAKGELFFLPFSRVLDFEERLISIVRGEDLIEVREAVAADALSQKGHQSKPYEETPRQEGTVLQMFKDLDVFPATVRAESLEGVQAGVSWLTHRSRSFLDDTGLAYPSMQSLVDHLIDKLEDLVDVSHFTPQHNTPRHATLRHPIESETYDSPLCNLVIHEGEPVCSSSRHRA